VGFPLGISDPPEFLLHPGEHGLPLLTVAHYEFLDLEVLALS